MRLVFFSLLLALSGCAATLAKVEPTDKSINTVRMYTGALAADGVYKSAFEKGASKACNGRSYKVVERTRSPSTLVNAGVELEDSNNFYWVVQCL